MAICSVKPRGNPGSEEVTVGDGRAQLHRPRWSTVKSLQEPEWPPQNFLPPAGTLHILTLMLRNTHTAKKVA